MTEDRQAERCLGDEDVARRRLERGARGIAGAFVVAALLRQQGIQKQRLRVFRRCLLHQRKLLVGRFEIRFGQVHHDDCVVHLHQIGLDRQRLLVGRQRAGLVVGFAAAPPLSLVGRVRSRGRQPVGPGV